MELPGNTLLVSLIALALLPRSVMGANPDTFSPVVSYQFQESLTEPGSQTSVSTPVVSYQYFEWPGNAILSFTDSPNVSFDYTYPPQVNVLPPSSLSFGNLFVGSTRNLQFQVVNNSDATISGTVCIGPPFTIIQGATYSLAPGQSQAVIVQFNPTTAGASSADITFSNGSSWLLTASAGADPTSTAGGISGQVTDTNGVALNDVEIHADSAASNTFTGGGGASTHTDPNGNYSLSNLSPGNYLITAYPPGPPFNYSLGTGTATVAAGNATICNIALTLVPPVQTPSYTNIPVVLVRGYAIFGEGTWGSGLPNDESGYWSAFRGDGANPSPYSLKSEGFKCIWDCNAPDTALDAYDPTLRDENKNVIDGTASVAYNARQLLIYILDEISIYGQCHKGVYPSSINIVCHSMGGLIVREMLGNRNYVVVNNPTTGTPIKVLINTVVMLATPNAGSNWADALYIETFPGTAALHDITTYSVTSYFNAAYSKWPDGNNLYLYAGTGGANFSDDIQSFQAFFPDLFLNALAVDNSFGNSILGLGPEAVSDGVVQEPSAFGSYYTPLNPNQIVSFYGSALEFQDSDPSIGAAPQNHLSMLTDSKTINWVTGILSGSNFFPVINYLAALQTAGNGNQLIRSNSLVATSSPGTARTALASGSSSGVLPLQMIDQTSVSVTSGTTVQLPEVSDAASSLRFQMLSSGTDVVLRLTDPMGNLINANTAQTNPNVQYSTLLGGTTSLTTIQIINPATGTWQAVIDGSTITEAQADCLLSVYGDSYIMILPQTALLYHQGQDAVISCSVVDASTSPATPVQNASVTATVTLPDGTTSQMSLFDDGLHNDGAANDGTYANVLPALDEAGDYTINYRVTGSNSQGQAFQRVVNSEFSVSTEDAGLLGDPVYQLIVADSDGVANYVKVEEWVNPSVAGNYVLSGQLVASTGTNTYSDSEQFYSDGSGPMMVNLIFNLNQIRASNGPGYYQVSNLQLFQVANDETAWLDTYEGSSGLNVTAPSLAITTVQGSQAVAVGQPATFSISAAGTGSLAYQWYQNGVAISGATSSSYTISDATGGSAGNYAVAVSDQYGDSSTSTTYTLTVDTGIPAMPPWAFATFALLLFCVAAPFLRAKLRKA